MHRNDQENPGDHHATAGSTTDRRALRTRAALHGALIRLILERDYDGIGVGEIADAANVGRSTFYAHFTDKDDLLRKGIGPLRDMLFKHHESAGAGEQHPASRTLAFSGFMTAHLKEQHHLYRALMRGRAGPIIIDKIKEFLSDLVRAELGRADLARAGPALGKPARRGPAPGNRPSEIAVHFVVGAYMSVVTWWLDRGAREAPEAIEQAFRDLALDGLKTLLPR